MGKLKSFLEKKNIVISGKRYGVDALGAMAQGLFASLLMLAVGAAANKLGGAGGPLAVYVVTIFASELGKAVSKETKIDILVTPLVTIAVGIGLSYWWAPAIGNAASSLGHVIMWATTKQPFLMGILVSVIVGMALTLPISSAAICAALSLTGLAGGAALAGCCAQMVGFAVLSFRENGWNGIISQGLGTSMLQMGNIVKNPKIWIVPTLVLRSCWSDRRVHGLDAGDIGRHTYRYCRGRLGWPCINQRSSARCSDHHPWNHDAQNRLDQAGRPQA